MPADSLIVGCSFVENLNYRPEKSLTPINPNHFAVRGKSGSGNQAIAARVAWEISNHPYKQVIVLWSGINRLDFPIGKPLHDTFPKTSEGRPVYGYHTDLGDVVWYHSGGFALSGCSDQCPKQIRDFFQNQYKSCTPRYLTDMTMLSVWQTQRLLESKGIPYKMGFIYDIHHPYVEHYLEPGLGMVDTTSSYYDQIDWSVFQPSTPYEWARDRNQLLADNFHPTFNGMWAWFKEEMAIDICA
jgi:hypothetical protein